jgi:UPF0755 protein
MIKHRFIIPLALTGILSGVFVYFLTFLLLPASPQGDTKILHLPNGVGLKKVAQLLKQNGIVHSQWTFVVAGKLMGAERELKAGEYRVHSGMSPFDILNMFRSGRVLLYELTVPEGFNLHQIANLLSENKLSTYEEFMKLAVDPTFVHSFGIKANTLEGYLYPETYFLPKDIGVEDILRTMVSTFHGVYTADMEERAQVLSMTRKEVVTLASMIEKETSVEEERPLISAVFHNRLKKRIPLQSDPTVIYALPDFDGNLKREDLLVHSPYNTYHVAGLPPGPIANPGQAALLATLYPAETSYLYFVSKNDGTHYFSRTLSEHNRAVERYQKRRVQAEHP